MYTTKVGIHIGYCMTFPDPVAFVFQIHKQLIIRVFGRRVLIPNIQGNNKIFL